MNSISYIFEKIKDTIENFNDKFSVKFNHMDSSLLIILIEKKRKKENNNIRKIEIMISNTLSFYEIKIFKLEKEILKKKIKSVPISITKVEGKINIKNITKDLDIIMQNDSDFKFYPKFPL